MYIKYGLSYMNIDVTNICLSKLNVNNIITIPSGDGLRANIFSDPLYRTLKKIFVYIDKNIYEYEDFYMIKINLLDYTITTTGNDIKLIHSKLKINYGSFNDELPEQKMVARYLTGCEKVLEIGGNIGRNSLVIAYILENSNNLVVLESDINNARQLIENKILNNFNFHVEKSALSKRKLIQHGWNTIPSDYLLNKYNWVNVISLDYLRLKYLIKFDTLVLDCEGAFYYILMDMPEILENINLIIMENDYNNIQHKYFIDDVLIKNNYIRDYVESGGWGCCYDFFYEVWKKKNI